MSERYNDQTYYELLEVTPKAGPSEIYNAYQRARMTYSASSPAIYSMFTPQEAKDLMALIEEAYQTLSHQGRRKEYDSRIGVVETKAAPARPATLENKPVEKKPEVKAPAKKEDAWVGPVRVVSARQEVPEGHGRTKFSVYKIDPEIEKEIAGVTECDGAFLQKVRNYKGVKIEQLCEEIRVMKSTLNALENNDLKALPVAVFTRGFVVQMARALGLDDKKITDAYMKFFRAGKVVR